MSSLSFSSITVKLGAAAMIVSSQVEYNFICFSNLFLQFQVFFLSWKHETLSSSKPSTANPRALDVMELIIISFDKPSHTWRTNWTVFRRGTSFILLAVVYSSTPLGNKSL